MIRVVGAPHFEMLRERLLHRLHPPGDSLWVADTVIVPSAAVRRQLSMDIAQSSGVCAQVDFGFLAQWLWQLMGRCLSGIAKRSALESSSMTWRIYDHLARPDGVARHPRLAAALLSGDPLQRFELSTVIAQLFETYATYRPMWLQQWQQGTNPLINHPRLADHPDAAWQHLLWQSLAQDMALAQEHPTDTFVRWLQDADEKTVRAALGHHSPVHVFALPAMAPQHLRVLQALSPHVQITLYVINPCAHYWFDAVQPRQWARLRLQGRAQHHEVTHPLLSAWGQQTQAYLNQLLQITDDVQVEEVDPEGDTRDDRTLLQCWQDSILHLKSALNVNPGTHKLDRSLEVHVCHSRVRELEVLHDRLLDAFSQDSTLRPGDVLVVMPQLADAAPWIHAVFGTVESQRHIPYAITALSASSEDEAAQTLQLLLHWLPSHWPVSQMLELMHRRPIAQHMGWSDDDLRCLEDWLGLAAVHWGRPPLPDDGTAHPHDLAQGLQRLFLGMALPADIPVATTPPDHAQALTVWPATPIGSAQSELLGRLWQWMSTLREMAQQMQSATTATQWVELLRALVHQTMGTSAWASPGLRTVAQAIDALHLEWQHAGWISSDGQARPHAPLTPEVVRQRLSRWWMQDRQGGVPTGSVTFSAMNSLRHLPFRVVCVLGLQDEAFPGASVPAECDLMAADPQPTDRQARQEARNVFLDLMLSARDVVHLSYTGRHIRDNAVLAPSVVISELLEFLGPLGSQVVVHHPLHPFSLAAFDPVHADPRCQSFHTPYAQALRHAQQRLVPDAGIAPTSTPTPASVVSGMDDDDTADESEADTPALSLLRDEPVFFSQPLPMPAPPPDGEQHVTLTQWIRFFHHPARYWLTRRLGIALPYRQALLDDHEPIWPPHVAAQALAQRVMPALLANRPHDEVLSWARCGAQVPPGALGEHWLEVTLPRLQRIAQRLAPLTEASPCHVNDTSLRLPLADGKHLRLHHRWSHLRASGHVSWYASGISPSQRLRLWWHHLLLCAQPPEGVQPHTTWADEGGLWRLRPVDNAQAVLAQAAQAWVLGQREPLAFFPRSSWAYVDAGGQAQDITPRALRAAAKAWRPGRGHTYAEGSDEAVLWVWRGRGDPVLDAPQQAAFAHWSATLMGPLRAHLEQLDGEAAPGEEAEDGYDH